MEILDGESHTSMCSPAFRRGLKWIFGKKSIDLYRKALEVDPETPSAIEALDRLEMES